MLSDMANAQGLDITKEELSKALEELIRERASKTETAVGEVREMSLDEMDHVAGGFEIYSKVCNDSFKDTENCYFNDNCSLVINQYSWHVVHDEVHHTWISEAKCRNTVKTKEWTPSDKL